MFCFCSLSFLVKCLCLALHKLNSQLLYKVILTLHMICDVWLQNYDAINFVPFFGLLCILTAFNYQPCMALNCLFCADVPLRNYSIIYSKVILVLFFFINVGVFWEYI